MEVDNEPLDSDEEIGLHVWEDMPQDFPEQLPRTVSNTRGNRKAWKIIRMLLHDPRLSIEDSDFFNANFFKGYIELTELKRLINFVMIASAFIQDYTYLYYNSVRLFCSVAWRHSSVPGETIRPPEESTRPPTGSNQSTAAIRRWSLDPVFSTMEPDWPRHLFERTDVAIKTGLHNAARNNNTFVSDWKAFFGSIPNEATYTEEQLKLGEEYPVVDFSRCILAPFFKLTKLLGVDVDMRKDFRVPRGGGDSRFDPDVPICYKGLLTLPVEIKKMPLKKYMIGGTLDFTNDGLLGIIEQEYRYMEMSGCEYGMITDFDIVIVMKIDPNTEEWSEFVESNGGKEDPAEFENLKKEIVNYKLARGTFNTSLTDDGWTDIEKKYKGIKVHVPISISVSKIGDTGFKSFTGLFIALALRECIYDITGDEQDRPRSEDEKNEFRQWSEKLTIRPSTFTRNTKFKDVFKEVRASGANNHVDNIERAMQISEGVYQQLEGFKVLQDARYQRQVYLFTFAAYAKMFPDARKKMKWLKDDDKVVLKVFNTSDAGYHMGNLKREKKIYPDTTFGEFIVSIADTYFQELKSYKLISSYNEKHPVNQIHVPQLHDYGYVSMCKEDKDKIDGYDFLFSGLFTLTSYIENQPSSITPDSINRCCEELRIMSEELNIQHNDVAKRNLIVNQGNIYLIDFSHAELYRSPFSLEEDQGELRKIGSELLKEREK